MESALLNRLRSEMRIVLVVGAVGSLGLMLRAARHTPRFLLVLFVLWVLLPFAVLLWATAVSIRWAAPTRATLYGVALVVTLGSLALYGGLVHRPAGSANAFMYVVVPPLSLALLAAAVSLAAFKTRRRARGRVEPP
jgi:hypothetical protein